MVGEEERATVNHALKLLAKCKVVAAGKEFSETMEGVSKISDFSAMSTGKEKTFDDAEAEAEAMGRRIYINKL